MFHLYVPFSPGNALTQCFPRLTLPKRQMNCNGLTKLQLTLFPVTFKIHWKRQDAKLSSKKQVRLDIRFMEDIFSTSFDSDYHVLGFSKLELDMNAASSSKVNEDMRADRKSRSRTRSRSRSRDPHSKHGRDGEYKERRHKRDKPTQERIPPSRRSSSTSLSSSSDSRQADGGRPRPTTSSVLHHAKSKKRSQSRSRSPHDKSRGDKRERCNNQKQSNKASEGYASEQVSNLAFRVQRIEGFLEQIATHMGLNSQDTDPGPGAGPQRSGPALGPLHNGALPKRSVDHSRRRDDDEVSLLASDEGIPDPQLPEQDLSQVCFNPSPDVATKWSPHEVITSYVSKYFGTKTDKEAISAQILAYHGAPDINNFVVPQINQTILMAPKVQTAKNVLEGDKHVANVQQMLMPASYPLLQLWNKIISQEEDFELEAEELLKDIQQSLCAIGSSFRSLNTHRRRHFKGCLAKEFSSLADSDSDEGLSPFLFGSNLAEKIKSLTEINSLSRKIVVFPPNSAYKPRAQMSRGKRKVYLRKRSYSGKRGARQGDRSRSQAQKEIKSSQTQTKVGGR